MSTRLESSFVEEIRNLFREAGLPSPEEYPFSGDSQHRMRNKRKDPVYTISGPHDAEGMMIGTSGQQGRIWDVVHPSEKGGVGYLLLTQDISDENNPGPWMVGQIIVRKDLRRKGIAQALYSRAFAWARHRGGFQSGWITGEGPTEMWQKWVEEGKAVVLPNGQGFRRVRAQLNHS